MRTSLRTRLTVVLIGLAVVPLLTVGGILIQRSFVAQRAQALDLQSHIAQHASSDVTAFIHGRERDLRLLVETWGLPQLDREQQASLLSRLLSYQDIYEELALLDNQGQEVIRVSRLGVISSDALGDRSGADFFEQPKASAETYYSSVLFDEVTDEPSMTIALPLSDLHSGEFTGVLVASVRFKTVWDLMAHLSGKSSIYIVDVDSRVVAHTNPSLVLRDTRFELPEEDVFTTGVEGAAVALAMDRIELGEQTFTIVSEQPSSEALHLANSTMYITFAAVLVALAAAVGLSILAVRQILRPIELLSHTAQAISTGDLSMQAVATGKDEIGLLAQSFNHMTVQLRDMIGNLEQRNQNLQATVQQYVEHMEAVAQGNLSVRIAVNGNGQGHDDPLALLGHSLNTTTASLHRMIIQIRNTANNLGSAVAEIFAATTQQAAGASEQSAAIAQASTTIDEVRTIAGQTAQRAQGVAESSQRTAQIAQGGEIAVTDTIQGMQEVKDKVDSISHEVLALSEKAQAIGTIISTVGQIASQSNMLALNAAVEAARAGEAGKGFAVVAQEVRSLAKQSRTATEQIRDVLGEIQHGVNTAVMATEEGIKGTDAGVQLTGEAGRAIEQLAEDVTASSQAALQIAAAAGQQLTGMEQIAQAMDNIHQVTAQSVTGARQVEQAAGEMNSLASQLRELVEQYEL